MDNTYGMEKLQQVNLYILKEIDRICTKYKLRYSLDAGTLLGAIRHSGFIPWDDDADIVMTRSNFEVFKKVAPRELPPNLSFVMPEDFKGGRAFYDFTPRICYLPSARKKKDGQTEYYEGKLNHLWVDIFILDTLPRGRITKKGVIFLQKFFYLLAMGHRYRIEYKKYGLLTRLGVGLFSCIGKRIPMGWIFSWENALSRAFRKSRSQEVYYSNYQPDYLHIRLKKQWLEKYSRILFEEVPLLVFDEYDIILSLVYGDYMTPPPRKDRVPTHESTEIQIYG